MIRYWGYYVVSVAPLTSSLPVCRFSGGHTQHQPLRGIAVALPSDVVVGEAVGDGILHVVQAKLAWMVGCGGIKSWW